MRPSTGAELMLRIASSPVFDRHETERRKDELFVAGIGDGGDGLKTEMPVHFRIDQSDPGKKITGKRRSFGEIADCRSGSLVTYKGSAALLPR